MSDKIERLFNLIALLLNTRRAITADEIRAKIPGYEEQSDVAFHRMFERDKAEVRDLGYTLEQEETGDGEIGYRVAKDEALLDDPGLTAAEMAALSLAAHAWTGRADGALALLKLSIGSGLSEPGATAWRPPRVDIDERVAALFDGLARRKRLTFRYRTGGGGDAQERTVDPLAVRHRGTWYLTGNDHRSGELRHFRLTRIDGPIHVNAGRAPDFDRTPGAIPDVTRGPWEGETTTDARVAFAPETAFWAERRTGARATAVRDDGWVEAEVPVADVASFAAWIAGFGDRAEALAPPDVRAAVVAHLRALREEA